jgi:ubiquinone/menaquinone biosynthesis C-methylase UbiE
MHYEAPDGIPNLRLMGDTRTDIVRRFYERAPFPDYPPRATLSWLRARAERSEFARLIDRAIPGDARVVEIGCGTGQMSLYLARADRVVIGADLTRESLRLGVEAARRFELHQIQFIETDLHHPGLRAGAFDVVYSSRVLHHTPDPSAAFARIVRLARPGGIIVLGVYNAIARIPLRARRFVARLSWIPIHPVIRCCATDRASQHDAKHGCGTNINIPRSTVTPWPRSKAGLRKMASNTCARIQAQCCVMTRSSCSLLPKTTGALRAGWHNLDGFVLLRTRVAFSLSSVGAFDRESDPAKYPSPA